MPQKDNKNDKKPSGFLDWFRNATLGAAMAEAPAIMTASGWRLNEKGDYVLDLQDKPEIKLLRSNLVDIGINSAVDAVGFPAVYGLYRYGLKTAGKAGSKWARAKLISEAIDESAGNITPKILNSTLTRFDTVEKIPLLEDVFKPNVRTKVGDVEVDNPAMYYRQGSKDNTTVYEFVPGYGYKKITTQPNTYIWINSKSAPMMTNLQWDDAYNAAISAQDYKEVLRLRDLHFQTKSNSTNVDVNGNPIHMYHGSPNTEITQFKHMGAKQGGRGTGDEGFYFTPKYSYAERYKAKHLMKDTDTSLGRVYDTYLNIQKPGYFPQDFPEASVTNFYQMSTPTRIAYELSGYDGLHLGKLLNNTTGKRPETVVFKNTQIKSAKPITYDNNGKIIPLSKRDDFTNPDIRFEWLAPLLGVSAAVPLTNSKTENK